ncbi:hypothetical protein DPMN_048120, partial [Dreissena polymorpha]
NEGPERNEVQSCNVNDCPVPCEDTINCAALSELNPCKTGLGPKVCPKTCGLCESGCFDLLNCSSEKAQAFFCRIEEDAIKYCRKTCRKCDKYPKPITLNQCMDPVDSSSICYTLHKEICVCKDESIKSICDGYCSGCGGTIRRNDTNYGCHKIDQLSGWYMRHSLLRPRLDPHSRRIAALERVVRKEPVMNIMTLKTSPKMGHRA